MTIDSSDKRPVRLYTPWGLIQGHLACPERMRTLDELNVIAKEFVTVQMPTTLSGSWELSDGNLAVHKNSILFVHESGAPPVQGAGDFGRFSRASVRLKVDGFTVHGFVHVSPGGSSMKRFENQRHPFVALTEALISGGETEAVVPFLAVNRARIAAVQELSTPAVAADSEDATDSAVDPPRPALLKDPG